MTNEESIKVLEQIRQWTDYPKEALTIAIEALSKPCLPSNLDEAANNYGVNIRLGYPRVMDETDRYIYNAFKAGAEWMAGQGETQQHFVIGSIADSPCGPAVVCYTEEFSVGDEVIVQIRKK